MMEKQIVYNDDGWSSYMRCPAPMSPEQIARITVGPLMGTRVGIYQFCALGGHVVNYRSTFLPSIGSTLGVIDTMHVWRMRETMRRLEALGTDALAVVADACHTHSIKLQYSLRMNDAHHTYRLSDGSPYFPELVSPWFTENADALQEPGGVLDYRKDKTHAYRIRQIAEILERPEVDGIDLDFTRFKPWFKPGEEQAGMPRMTELVSNICSMARDTGRFLSARFEYDPQSCMASGLDVGTMIAEKLFDHITLGGVGDHTPDAPIGWWIERAHDAGCKVYPGIEGQLHWAQYSGCGGLGTHPGDGVMDGFGPPSEAYMRGVAAVHYMNGADGISLFNFTCADGPFSRRMLCDLADPDALTFRDKQYVAAVWPMDAQIDCVTQWTSRFRLTPLETTVEYPLHIADDMDAAIQRAYEPMVTLTLDLINLNHVGDCEVLFNGCPLLWTGYHYNHYDHGLWSDVLQFNVPQDVIRKGQNCIGLIRCRNYEGFAGALEVRKCILEVKYGAGFSPGRVR